MPRTEPWTIADLLDFEYLLAADAERDEAGLRERDRALLADHPSNERRALFKHWLESRRAAEPGTLPGQHFRSGWQTLLTLAALGGVALGASLTAGLLHYRGAEPVNVAWFFAATVAVQWVLLLFAFVVWLLRRTTGLLDDFHPLHALLAAALPALNAGWRRLPGESRERLHALFATLRHRREIYGSLTTWPLLVVTQLFGVCFNVGVLATLLLHVALSDVAFGWQSTLRTSPEEAHRLVSMVATPWTFAPYPHPTLAQVVASRFLYSEGLRHDPETVAAMRSWWPFLCYAVAAYGLAVRALLLGWATVKGQRALTALAFDHHGCNALYRRLTGPLIHADAEAAGTAMPPATNEARLHTTGECLVLVAPEITLDRTLLTDTLRQRYGWQLREVQSVPVDHPSGSTALLADLAKVSPGLTGIAILVPAHRAPIRAIAIFLQKVAAAAGTRVEVLVLLVGRRTEAGFAEVDDAEFSHWRNFNAIHGLHLGLEKWPAT